MPSPSTHEMPWETTPDEKAMLSAISMFTTSAIQTMGMAGEAHEAYLNGDSDRAALLALGALRTSPQNPVHRFMLAMVFVYARNRQAICALPLARRALEILESQVKDAERDGGCRIEPWERRMVLDFRLDYDVANRVLVKEQLTSKKWLSYSPVGRWWETIPWIRRYALHGDTHIGCEVPGDIYMWDESVLNLLSPNIKMEDKDWFSPFASSEGFDVEMS